MNQIITAAELKDEIKFGLKGIYLFFGEEEYMKQYYLSEIRKKLLPSEDEAIFSHKRISCAELNFEQISDALQTASFGFFGSGKILCELHEIPFKSMKESEWTMLLEALSQASDDVITVIYAVDGDIDLGLLPKKPSKQLQKLLEYAKGVNFPREGELKVAKWISKHFVKEGLSYENGVCEKMISYCGRDMLLLSGEIAKICAYVREKGESRITLDDLKKVCSRSLEINAFDFSNALLNQNTDRALEILSDMKLKKEKPLYMLSSVLQVITDLYSIKVLIECGYNDIEISRELKIHEYKVGLYRKSCEKRPLSRLKRLLEFCSETDVKLKSSSADDYTELDKLVILATSK